MMREEVNKIVFNELAAGRALWLPEVGSFVPEYRSALRASSRRLEPPERRVVFLSGEKGESLIDLIARAGECDAVAAGDIYNRWLAQVRTQDGLAIEGVGRLEHRYFNAAPPLDAMLCPLGRASLALRPRRSRVPLYAAGGLIVLAVAVYGIRWYGARERLSVGETVRSELLAASSEGAPQGGAVENSVADESVGRAVLASGGEIEADRPTPDIAVAEEAAPRTEAAAAREEFPEQPIARMQAGRTYVVGGVYSTEENARRAVAEQRREHPGLSPRIYFFGSKWMLSLFESDAAEECRAFINREGRELEGLWPYTKKR